MEEVDAIIIQFLRHLNLNINDDIKALIDLPVETIFEAASKCILSINKNLKVPTKLPTGISQRIEIAGQLASICKDLGFKSDVGYQTFLYYNETELLQVFMFLIERLPNEGKINDTKVEDLNERSQLLRSIGQKIDKDLNAIWIPPCCEAMKRQPNGQYVVPPVEQPQSTLNISNEELIKKLQRIKKEKSSSDSHTGIVCDAELDLNDIVIQESLKELKEKSIVLRQKLDSLESDKNVMEVEYKQAQKSCEKFESDLFNLQNILNSLGISDVDDLGNDNLLENVQKNIDMLHTKSEEFTSKSLCLKVKINNFRNNNMSPGSEKIKYKNILTHLKRNARVMKEEYIKKEQLKEHLKKEYENIKKGNKRSVYTKRILEIISNVDKQNMEIKKILDDTRHLQKEINVLEGQLDRCFSIADETLFRDAKKDDQAKKAYKLLALLHSECNTIVNLVNDTGALARDIIDLEDNIKSEKAKRTEDTLIKIKDDLSRMQEELKNV